MCCNFVWFEAYRDAFENDLNWSTIVMKAITQAVEQFRAASGAYRNMSSAVIMVQAGPFDQMRFLSAVDQ
jgi:hypothetical protein